ncbi:MAG: OmpA family protein [Bacteroides sp.]|nr:OmpA family protein [Prevotella sp.]MCM1406899.1 OmpA family protein [Treponema brennaborense]MCM1470050.1 OmpA family protein [Bacteroides sp.]
MSRIFCAAAAVLIFFAHSGAHAQLSAISNALHSESIVDWTEPGFVSDVSLNILKAGIPLPSGRSAAEDSIQTQLPQLIKDPLLTLAVDASTKIGDAILLEDITMEQLTNIIDNGRTSSSYFADGLTTLKINHSVSLNEIGALMVKHHNPYTPQKPIELVSSRTYSGIIIDARGLLPVQGEFVQDTGTPCLFPRIWDDTMEVLYERNMMDSDAAKASGIITYSWTDDESAYKDRVGYDPLKIYAKKIFGINRTDPVISRKDALKILSVPQNLELIKKGKIVILLDKDKLRHPVYGPRKDESYYVVYRQVADFYYERKIPDTEIQDTYKGIQLSLSNIRFEADSAVILPGENDRLNAIAESLKNVMKDTAITIQVEGHTASVGKPAGEQRLSVERAQTIINQLVNRGIPEYIFASPQGYGGTIPLADNSSAEGRAKNRRVELIILPSEPVIDYRQRSAH